jgi:hypothetical protein
VTEGAPHAPAAAWREEARASCKQIALKLSASNVLELFQYAQQGQQARPQRTIFDMAAVYKTLSQTENHDKEPGEKRNKQRVLILV